MRRSLLSRSMPVALAPVVVGALTLSACETEYEGGPAVDTAAEAETIMSLEREWSTKFGEGDLDYIVNLHATDAIQLPPNADPIVGAAALRAAWEGMINTDGLTVTWEPTAAFVSASGDMAWDYGTASLTTPDGVTAPMKYMVVWVRRDGEWKVAADMFNASAPPQ